MISIFCMFLKAALLFQTGDFALGEKILLSITSQDSKCEVPGSWKNLATVYGKQHKYEKV